MTKQTPLDNHRLLQRLLARLGYYDGLRANRSRLDAYHAHKQRHVLPNLARALQKARQGRSQLCDDCGGTITAGRLLAVPGALRCISSQQDYESASR